MCCYLFSKMMQTQQNQHYWSFLYLEGALASTLLAFNSNLLDLGLTGASLPRLC